MATYWFLAAVHFFRDCSVMCFNPLLLIFTSNISTLSMVLYYCGVWLMTNLFLALSCSKKLCRVPRNCTLIPCCSTNLLNAFSPEWNAWRGLCLGPLIQNNISSFGWFKKKVYWCVRFTYLRLNIRFWILHGAVIAKTFKQVI